MASWEAGPTPYAAPTSPAGWDRAEPGALPAASTSMASTSMASTGMAPLWLDVLDETARMCAAYRRADLVGWLRQRRAQLLDPQLRVLVVGAPKQGKSQLINALINAPVCAVGDDQGTVLPTVVRHAATPSAHLVRASRSDSEPEDRVAIPVDGIADNFAESARQRFGAGQLVHAEVGVPRSLLAGGLTIIDTPAWTVTPTVTPAGTTLSTAPAAPVPMATMSVSGPPDPRTLAAYLRVDLVLLACESSRELSTAELALLTELNQLYPSVAVVLTKTDFSPQWRDVAARNRQCLTRAGVSAAVLPVSAALRLHAARTGDAHLNAESGFPHLIAYLRQAVEAKPDRLARAGVGLLGRITIEALAGPLRAQLAERSDGGSSDAMARLHEAQRRVDELRRSTTRWQNCLSDEVGDLMSDIEQDLRERTRAILAKADETFDSADPIRVWDTFDGWLQQALREAAEASFSWLVERTEWLTERIAGFFPLEAVEVLPRWSPTVPDDLGDRVAGLGTPRVERLTAGQKLFTGLRGSYGGLLMAGLASTMADLPLLNPISLGAGAIFGGKSIRDESKSMLKRRQAVAKTAVQRHVDEVFVRLNKDAKDTIRRVQRVLRDHFGAVTEDLQEAIVESLRSAKQAADHDAAAREQEVRRIQQELARLAELYEQVQALNRLRGATIPSQRKPMP